MPQTFQLEFAEQVEGHLASIERKYHSLIRDNIEEQLRLQPLTETRNRKPLRQPAAFGATWELRFGPDNRFRVLYTVEDKRVLIVALGVKEGSRLTVGGEEVTS